MDQQDKSIQEKEWGFYPLKHFPCKDRRNKGKPFVCMDDRVICNDCDTPFPYEVRQKFKFIWKLRGTQAPMDTKKVVERVLDAKY